MLEEEVDWDNRTHLMVQRSIYACVLPNPPVNLRCEFKQNKKKTKAIDDDGLEPQCQKTDDCVYGMLMNFVCGSCSPGESAILMHWQRLFFSPRWQSLSSVSPFHRHIAPLSQMTALNIISIEDG